LAILKIAINLGRSSAKVVYYLDSIKYSTNYLITQLGISILLDYYSSCYNNLIEVKVGYKLLLYGNRYTKVAGNLQVAIYNPN
jgi:hypothetical protein